MVRTHFLVIVASLVAFRTLALDVDVVLLGGQSNADGRAVTNDLPVELQGVQTNVLFYHGNADGNASVPGFTLTSLQPGGSSGSAGTFGPEVSMGYTLADALTNRQTAIIKYANGSTSLAVNWASDSGADYRAFTNTVGRGLQALEDVGHTPRVIAMTWLQGERDGQDDAHAAQYVANLTAFIARMRSLYGPDMSFVVAQISNGGRYPAASWTTVQQAQADVAAADTNADMFVTHDLPLKADNLHYTADGLVTIGERFAHSITNLLLGITNAPPGPDTNAPLLYYPFDADTSDASPLGNDGMAVGDAGISGHAHDHRVGGGGLVLDGDGDRVELASPVVFGPDESWTVALWARLDAPGKNGMMLGQRASTDDFMWLNDPATAFAGFRFRSSVRGTYDFDAVYDTNWHHYALVATGGTQLTLYTDGYAAQSLASTNTSFRIDTVGRAYSSDPGDYDFDGAIDEVRVYGRALSPWEVYDLYHPEQGVHERLWLPFDADFRDTSGNGNDGVPVASPSICSGGLALGRGSYLLLTSPIRFAAWAPWSVTFWGRRGVISKEGMVIGEHGTHDDFIWLNSKFDGFRFRNSLDVSYDFVTSMDTDLHHYALAADGTGNLVLYVDGEHSSEKTGTNTSIIMTAVGSAYNAAGLTFNGSLDEVRVFEGQLSPEQVMELYTSNRLPLLAEGTVLLVR